MLFCVCVCVSSLRLVADEVSAVVIDMGTTSTKAGFAGEDSPKYVIPSSVGIIGGEEGADRVGASNCRVGTNALSVHASGMRVQPAVEDGIVTHWDSCEAILEHTFKSCLSCNAAEHPLLMAEASHNTPAAREKLAEIAFERIGVPALFLSKNAVLTAFASGRGTALVLDIGGGVTSTAAVHDGYVLSRTVRRQSLAGDLINELVLRSAQLRAPAPSLLPLYTLKRTEVGPGEFSCKYIDHPGTHPTFHKYHLLQVSPNAPPRLAPSNAPSAD
jgi:actin-like protein 6A